MWRLVIFTLAALRAVKTLRFEPPLNYNPSAISNIKLLVPIGVSRFEHGDLDSNEDLGIDDDEPYSSIPAYAFTIDENPIAAAEQAQAKAKKNPKPELIPSTSFYLNTLKKRKPELKGKKQDAHKRSEDKAVNAKLTACHALANQHSSEARDVLLYLCTELVDVVATRCDCCDNKETKKKPASILPWFGTIRRHHSNSAVRDEHSANKHEQRVFV